MMNDKKGALTFKFIFAILVLIAIIFASIIQAEQKALFEDRPFTAAQTAILRAAVEGEKALVYLDFAADIAAEQAKESVAALGACEPDYEEGTFPCGTYMGTCRWADRNISCIPDIEATVRATFESYLFSHLYQHPQYAYPSFATSFTFNAKSIDVVGASEEPLSIRFTAGGKQGFLLEPKTKYLPDYEEAEAGKTLNHALRNGNDASNLVVHYTAGNSVGSAVSALSSSRYSYHYIIDENGKVHQYVPEDKAAQHAGCEPSPICLLPGMNQQSIGISFVNCGWDTGCMRNPSSCVQAQDHNGKDRCWEPYTSDQLESFVKLAADVIGRNERLRQAWQVDPSKVFWHSDIKSTKTDPGPLFEQEWPDLQRRINDLLAAPAGHPQTHFEDLPQGLHVLHDDPQIGPDPNTGTYQLSDAHLEAATRPLDSSSAETYIDLAQWAAERYAIKQALLLAIMHVESSYGLDDHCSGKSSLTGCGWHDACASGCGCAGTMTTTPKEQLRCTAATLRTAYKEATTTNDYAGGAYAHCRSMTDPWPCIIEAYGPQAALPQGSTTPSFTNYPKAVLGAYDAWSDYLAGNDLQDLRVRLDGGYKATYDVPLGFTISINVSKEGYAELQQTIEDILQYCKDNHTCFLESIEWHNITKPGNKLSLKNCTDNPLADEFLYNLLACDRFPDDVPCTFTLAQDQMPQGYELFSLYFDKQEGIQELRKRKAGIFSSMKKSEYRVLIPRMDLTNVYTDRRGSQTYDATKYIFFNKTPLKVWFGTDANQPPPLGIGTKAVSNHPFTFIKKQGVLHIYDEFTPQPDAGYFAPIKMDYLLCQKDSGITFALTLDDPIPPAVTGIFWRDNITYGRYDLEWAPVTTYANGDPVIDVMEYRIYCSKNPLPKDRLPDDYLALTITRADGKPFPQADYAAIPAMTAPLETCEGNNIDRDPVHIAIVAVDALGQLNFSYQDTQLTRSPLVVVGTTLPYPLDHAELQEESFVPLPRTPFPGSSMMTGPLTNIITIPIPGALP